MVSTSMFGMYVVECKGRLIVRGVSQCFSCAYIILFLILAWKEWQLPTPVESESRGGDSPVAPPTTLHAIAEEEGEEESSATAAGTPQNGRCISTCIYMYMCT